MIEYLQSKPKDTVVADLGCGEGKIAENVQCKVVSFDLSGGDRIVKCDIGKVRHSEKIHERKDWGRSRIVANNRPFLINVATNAR